jgi:hypothetical protein
MGETTHGPNPAHGFGLSARRPVGCCSLTAVGTAQQQLDPAGSAAHRVRASAVTVAGDGAVARAAMARR